MQDEFAAPQAAWRGWRPSPCAFCLKDFEDVKKGLGFQQLECVSKRFGSFLTPNVLITRFSLNFLFKKPASGRIDDAVDHAARLLGVLALTETAVLKARH